jgi:SAM-dependent methyltransferase
MSIQNPNALYLETDYEPSELRNILKSYEPWGHLIEFSNGVSTSEFKKRVPFSDRPLGKIKLISQKINLDKMRGGKVLDIGCNSGYNSIYCATQFQMSPVGIDITPRHIQVSQLLSKIANVNGEYLVESAETFCRSDTFDLVLHFGTLYHLPNPLLSLQSSFKSLKTGGYIAIETQCYNDPTDQNLCYFMNMQNNDPTNFWALSNKVVMDCLRIIGFVECEMVKQFFPPILEKNMSRVFFVAKKP